MKNLIIKIKNLFSKSSKKVKETSSPIKPYHDWAMIFTLSVFGVILVASFGTYLLFIMQNGKFFGEINTESSSKKGFEEAKLVETILIYKKKVEDFDLRTAEKPTALDPSL